MSKYDPINYFLENMNPDVVEQTLTFKQFEQILGSELPKSAKNHRAWWANERIGSHVQAHAWMDARWEVNTVNQQAEWVKFRRLTMAE